MALRLVLAWTTIAVATQAAIWLLFQNLPLAIHAAPFRELMTPFVVCVGPAGQWLALRICRVPFRREWFFATLAAGVLWSAAFDSLRYLKLWPVLQYSLLYTLLLTSMLSGVLRWLVLRRHVDRAGWWFLAAAVSLAAGLAARSFTTGTMLGAMRATLPSQLLTSLGPALVESVFLGWLFSTARPGPPRDAAPSRAWTWLEWTAAASFAVLTTVHASQAVEIWLRRGRLLLAPPIFSAIGGTVIGGVQWLFLRRRLGLDAIWIPVSAAAITIPALGILVPGVQFFAVYIWVYGTHLPGVFALLGAWFGFWQWLILRTHLANAWVWIPANALAWSTWQLRLFPATFSITTMGVIAGAITGLALFAILRPRAAASQLVSISPRSP
jgi:hypothetical protein